MIEGLTCGRAGEGIAAVSCSGAWLQLKPIGSKGPAAFPDVPQQQMRALEHRASAIMIRTVSRYTVVFATSRRAEGGVYSGVGAL